jgi:hypothetical protein
MKSPSFSLRLPMLRVFVPALLALIFAVGLSAPSHAQSPAQPTAQASIGRLFYTPEERAYLEAEKTPRAAAEPLPARRYQGVLRRHRGPATVWLDERFKENAPPPNWPVGEREGARDLLRGGKLTVYPASPSEKP